MFSGMRSQPKTGIERATQCTVGMVLLTCALMGCAAEKPGSTFSKGPYLQAAGPGAMKIRWESLTNSPATVWYGLGDNLDQVLRDIAPVTMVGVANRSVTNVHIIRTNGLEVLKTNLATVKETNSFYLYEANLADLRPGAEYSYRVDLRQTKSPKRSFRTLDGVQEEVQFIAYGDSRSNPQIHSQLTKQFLKYSPDFLLHTGDLVAKGKDYGLWYKEFFHPLAKVIDRVPLFSVIGNHEEDGTNYLAYFHLGDHKTWYSFDAGPVHVLALDYRYEEVSSEQYRFAAADLKKNRAPWTIVIVHEPAFNIGGHASGWGHDHLLSLFHEHKVDLVIGGHSHLYERFRPVARTAGDWPITCITTGGGGASLYPDYDHPSLVSHSRTNHFMVFTVSRDELQAKMIAINGKTLDSFTLRKPGGSYDSEYRARVYPEGSLKLFPELAPGLASLVGQVPTPTNWVDVMLTMTPRKTGRPPAQLELSLHPDSALYYELLDSPLRMATPLKGTTNTVWLKVRSTGRKKVVADKNTYLDPLLVIQANATVGQDNTTVFGRGAKVSKSVLEAAKQR